MYILQISKHRVVPVLARESTITIVDLHADYILQICYRYMYRRQIRFIFDLIDSIRLLSS